MKLTQRQREVLALMYFERVSEREAASILGITKRAVVMHHRRALAKIPQLTYPATN